MKDFYFWLNCPFKAGVLGISGIIGKFGKVLFGLEMVGKML